MDELVTNDLGDVVTISRKEYQALLDRDDYLSSLEAAGVDNWEGCDHAYDIRVEWAEEDQYVFDG